MKYHAGLDISLEETAICVVDDEGAIVKELRASSEPEVLAAALGGLGLELARVGLEACSQAAWLHDGLKAAGFNAICIETRRAHAAMKTMPNKTDRNDARAIAQIMRTGWFQQVHVKSPQSRCWRALLVARKGVLHGMLALENVVRGLLREEGLKAGKASGRKFTDTVKELARADQALDDIVTPILEVLVTMQGQLADMTARVVAIAGADPVCRRLMGVPGMGAITTLTFMAAVDSPDRFKRSRTLGAHLGLTPKRYQSGETDIAGRISKCGDGMARSALYEAAHVLLVLTRKPSGLKAWGLAVAKRRGLNRARVAVARKLAVILHSMWEDGANFIWSARQAAKESSVALQLKAV